MAEAYFRLMREARHGTGRRNPYADVEEHAARVASRRLRAASELQTLRATFRS